MASPYLTLFVHHERPEHQIQLVDGAALSMADGDWDSMQRVRAAEAHDLVASNKTFGKVLLAVS